MNTLLAKIVLQSWRYNKHKAMSSTELMSFSLQACCKGTIYLMEVMQAATENEKKKIILKDNNANFSV